MADTVIDLTGLAAVTTTDPGATPNYGLALDLATGQWMDAGQFREFARAQMTVSQQRAQEQAAQVQKRMRRSLELQRARNFEQGGLFKTDEELLLDREGVGNQIMRGFKAIGGYGGQFFDHILSGGNRDDEEQLKNAYARYAKKGGLLSREEFESFSPGTQLMLLEKGALGQFGKELLQIPGAKATLKAADQYAYRPAIAFTEMMLDPEHAEWNAIFSRKEWAEAWQEAQGESLGNALIDGIFESAGWADDDTLARWKRDNPWYQMSSVGAEFAVAWYADPLVVGGKAAGGAARLKKNELPLSGRQSIAIREGLQGQPITAVRNPITKAYVNFRVNRIEDAQRQVEDYIRAGATVADLTRLPMFQSRSRVVDGGLAANTLHYAVTKQDELNRLINSPRVREGLGEVTDELPETLDILDLTWRLQFGDAQAWAVFKKLEAVAPDELLEIAPGAGELIDRVNALRTKHDTLQQEVDDLLKEQAAIEGGTGRPGAFHRWEVHSSLEVRSKQLADANNALHRYEGYKDFLEDFVGRGATPHISRVSKPTTSRWSEVRSPARDPELTETRQTFSSGFYGRTHTITKIPKGLFVKRANTASLHDVDSSVLSINRQFDQFEHLYDYAPPGLRDSYVTRVINAKDEYERYRIFHELEEDHFVAAVVNKFGIEEDLARTILNRIHDERNKTIQGILRGDKTRYGSAPALADRVKAGDPNVELVSRNPDTGEVTINLMVGHNKETFVVPEEALFERKGPQDVTQLPNYYNPLDHRRVYYQLKHDQQRLAELNAGVLSRGQAALAEAGTWAGTNFNKFWKPYQLFRAAWPMRVLMDEGMRAMAILGPMYWLKHDGMEAMLRTLPASAATAGSKLSKSRRDPIGIARGAQVGPRPKQAKNAFVRDHEVRAAVTLPENLFPRLDAGRLGKAQAVSQRWFDFEARRKANIDWAARRRDELRDGAPERTPTQERLAAYGRQRAHEAEDSMGQFDAPPHPIIGIAADARQTFATDRVGLLEKPKVYDPISGREVRSGYFVQTSTETIPLYGGAIRPDIPRRQNELVEWYQRNAEMLSRQGMRVMATADPATGKPILVVGRWFSGGAKKSKYKQARETAEYVSEKSPDVRLWHLHRPGYYQVVRPDDDSPARQAMYRYFASEETLETHRTEGAAAPMTGPDAGKEVYHGSAGELPDPLLPRDDVEVINGNMVGPGLYTTRELDIAESPGYSGGEFPYVVMDSRTGEKYDPFDLDQAIADTDKRDLRRFLRENGERFNLLPTTVEILMRMVDSPPRGPYLTARPGGISDSQRTWANLYEDIVEPDQHRALHAFLEEVRGAGVLTHKGGTTHEHPHQVYVWLHPENLVVKPLFTETSRFTPFPRWIDGNMDFKPVDNLLPENRIIRKKAEPQPIAALPEGSNPLRGEMRQQELAVADVEAMDMSRLDELMDSKHGWLMNKLRELAEQGVGYKKLVSSDGQEVRVESAYSGHRGQLFRALVGSNGVLDVLSEGHGSGTSMYRQRSEGWRHYAPPKFTESALKPGTPEFKRAVRYFQVYADTINDHLGNSPIIQRMSRGWDDDRLIEWLDETPEGIRVRDTIKPKATPTGMWVEEFRHKLNYYVPSPKLQRLLGQGRLEPSDFRKNIADEDLPTVYGPDFEVLDRRRGAGELVDTFLDKMYHAFGTVPIDRLSRHPFAKAMYDAKMQELIASTKGKWITNELKDHYQTLATKHAMNEVERTLYTLLDSTNFTDALRFIAPFWGAQYEAITKWLRIISNRPETVARFFAGQRAVYQNFVVVDQEGNVKETALRDGGLHDLGLYQPEDMVVMPLPKFITSRFPGLEQFAEARIPIGSANTVLQGDLPLMPGLGPLVTVPADLLLKEVSKTYGVEHDQDFVYRWFFPVGRPRSGDWFGRVMEQISPGWSRRLQQASGSQNMTSRLNMEMQIGREMLIKAREKDPTGKSDPTAEEISKAADFMYGVRTVSSFLLPVQVQYVPKHQYWIDAYHKMQRDYGVDAWDKFVEKYGEEAAAFAVSSSNSIGVPSTRQGMRDWAGGGDKLMAKFPEWSQAIVSPEAYLDEFSPEVYGQQFNISIGPGTTKKLRETASVEERLVTEPQVRLGWREYRKLSAAIEAELANRGLKSIQQKDAEGLRLYKRDMVASIIEKHPAWAEEYHRRDDNIYDRINELYQFAGSPMFDTRPDFRGVRQYLQIRSQVVDRLETWAAQGGSPSLQSEQNGALRQWFYDQVGDLILDNPSFAEFYTRYLESDTLELGGGGYR